MRSLTLRKPGMVLWLLGLIIMLPLSSIGQTIEIQVSPNILNLQNNGQVVTVHTDIPYSDVVGSTVSMEGVAISSWKADNGGYFVAKFLMDEIVNLPLTIDDYNVLTLEGTTTDGGTFTGSDDVFVINNIPRGKN